MVSTSFVTANHTVNGRGKLPKSGIVIRKLSFAHRNHAALSLTIAAQILRCRGAFSLVTAVRFSNGQEVLSIDYSGAKYARFSPKIAAMQKSLFEWLKTAISSNACGTSTLKSPLLRAFFTPHVHPRPRKRPPRCTLDCGFKTSESPALRDFVAERCPIRGTSLYLVLKSNGLRHSKNLPVKFGFSPRTVPANIAKKLPAQRCSKPHFIAFFSLSHKRPTFAFTGESGYTLGFRRRIAHSGSHAETRAFRMGGWYHYSRSVPHVHQHPRAGYQNGKFCRFWALTGCALKNTELSEQRCAYARRCSEGVAAPAGLRDPASALLIMW